MKKLLAILGCVIAIMSCQERNEPIKGLCELEIGMWGKLAADKFNEVSWKDSVWVAGYGIVEGTPKQFSEFSGIYNLNKPRKDSLNRDLAIVRCMFYHDKLVYISVVTGAKSAYRSLMKVNNCPKIEEYSGINTYTWHNNDITAKYTKHTWKHSMGFSSLTVEDDKLSRYIEHEKELDRFRRIPMLGD